MSLFSQPHSARPPGAPAPRPARWLALGDSYTIGEGVPETARWPVRVAALIGEKGEKGEKGEQGEQGLRLEPPRILAATGWTTDELLAGMQAAGMWPAHEEFELVSLLIGVNDQYRGRSRGEFAPRYAECLARAVALAGGHAAHVLALSIPDWGVTPFAKGRDSAGIARTLDGYNAEERARVAAAGAHWCDITPLSRRHGADPAFLAADGLHPGPAAYAEWARAALPAARAALAGHPPARD